MFGMGADKAHIQEAYCEFDDGYQAIVITHDIEHVALVPDGIPRQRKGNFSREKKKPLTREKGMPREEGTVCLYPNGHAPIPKRSCAYTQTIVRLYPI